MNKCISIEEFCHQYSDINGQEFVFNVWKDNPTYSSINLPPQYDLIIENIKKISTNTLANKIFIELQEKQIVYNENEEKRRYLQIYQTVFEANRDMDKEIVKRWNLFFIRK